MVGRRGESHKIFKHGPASYVRVWVPEFVWSVRWVRWTGSEIVFPKLHGRNSASSQNFSEGSIQVGLDGTVVSTERRVWVSGVRALVQSSQVEVTRSAQRRIINNPTRSSGPTAASIPSNHLVSIAPLPPLSSQAAARLSDDCLNTNHPPLPITPEGHGTQGERYQPSDGRGRSSHRMTRLDKLLYHTVQARGCSGSGIGRLEGPIVFITPGEGNAQGTSPPRPIPESIEDL